MVKDFNLSAKYDNQIFCYWLQGFFEISKVSCLNKQKTLLIQDSLKKINEPLGYFTQWLSDVIKFLKSHECNQKLIDFFLPEIRDRLSFLFFHMIDQSYDTEISLEESQKIHDGVI